MFLMHLLMGQLFQKPFFSEKRWGFKNQLAALIFRVSTRRHRNALKGPESSAWALFSKRIATDVSQGPPAWKSDAENHEIDVPSKDYCKHYSLKEHSELQMMYDT